MKIQDDILKKQMAFVETFLNEFCEVKGIKEAELKEHLQIATCVPDNSVMVVNVDDIRDVKFGVKLVAETDNIEFEVFGEYLDQKDEYPKLWNLLTLNNYVHNKLGG